MPELDRKSTSVFAGKVVRKDLVRKVKVGANVPVFVLEYLLGKYCATDDPAAIDAGLRVVNTTLTENFVRPDEANAVQSKVKDKGKYTLIDKIKVRYLNGHKVAMGIGQPVDMTDFHVEGIDLLANRVPCECGIALIVAVYSALKKHQVLPGLLILGDLSIQGNIKSMRSLAEPLQIAMENGARRALIPLENKRNFLEVSGDIMERVDPIFYSDPTTAAMKALGMT